MFSLLERGVGVNRMTYDNTPHDHRAPTIPAPWADDIVLINRKPRLIYEAHQAMLTALNGYARDTKKLAPVGFKDAWRDILMYLCGGLEIEDSEMRLSYQFSDTPDTDPVRALRNRIRAATQEKVLALLAHPATAQAVARHVLACTQVMLQARDGYLKEHDGVRLVAGGGDGRQVRRKPVKNRRTPPDIRRVV